MNEVMRYPEITKIYLFGSYHSGKYTDDSDIDLAFFVKENTDLLDIHRKITGITSKCRFDIQPQIFFESEIAEKNGIIGEIIENGCELSFERITE